MQNNINNFDIIYHFISLFELYFLPEYPRLASDVAMSFNLLANSGTFHERTNQ